MILKGQPKYKVLLKREIVIPETSNIVRSSYPYKAVNIDPVIAHTPDSAWTNNIDPYKYGIPYIRLTDEEIIQVKGLIKLGAPLWDALHAVAPIKLIEAINFIEDYRAGKQHALTHAANQR